MHTFGSVYCTSRTPAQISRIPSNLDNILIDQKATNNDFKETTQSNLDPFESTQPT